MTVQPFDHLRNLRFRLAFIASRKDLNHTNLLRTFQERQCVRNRPSGLPRVFPANKDFSCVQTVQGWRRHEHRHAGSDNQSPGWVKVCAGWFPIGRLQTTRSAEHECSITALAGKFAAERQIAPCEREPAFSWNRLSDFGSPTRFHFSRPNGRTGWIRQDVEGPGAQSDQRCIE